MAPVASATYATPIALPPLGPGLVRPVFHMEDCEGCAIETYLADGRLHSTSDPVVGGSTFVDIPNSKSQGITFLVSDPQGYSAGNAWPAIVLRYEGLTPGQDVDSAMAASATKGNHCWAGGTQGEIHINVRAERSEVDTGGDRTWDGKLIRLWASPTIDTVGAMSDAPDGIIGINGTAACERNS